MAVQQEFGMSLTCNLPALSQDEIPSEGRVSNSKAMGGGEGEILTDCFLNKCTHHSFIYSFIYQVQFINKFIKFLRYVRVCSEHWEHSSEQTEQDSAFTVFTV